MSQTKFISGSVSASQETRELANQIFASAKSQDYSSFAGLEDNTASVLAQVFGQISTKADAIGASFESFDSEALRSTNGAVIGRREVGIGYESYTETDYDKFMQVSIVAAQRGIRQELAAEAWFTTTVLSPREHHVSLSIEIPVVMPEHNHATDGRMAAIRKTTVHALRDDSILASDVLKIIPNAAVVGKDEYFVDSTLVANADFVTAQKETIATRPLAAGVSIPMFELAVRPNELGAADHTDEIQSARLNKVFFDFGGKVYSHDISGSATANYTRMNAAGETNELILASTSIAINLNADSKLHDGTSITDIAAFSGLGTSLKDVVFNISLNGRVNTTTGILDFNKGTTTVVLVNDINGDAVPKSDAAYTGVVAAVQGAKMFGAEAAVLINNLNRRKIGKLAEVQVFSQKYALEFHSPISVVSPTLKSGAELEEKHFKSARGIGELQYAANSNRGIAAMFKAYEQAQRAAQVWDVNGSATSDVWPGLIRYVLRPYTTHETIDVLENLQHLTSDDKLKNIRAVLRDTMYADVARAASVTNWYGVAQSFDIQHDKINVEVVTSPEIAAYLAIDGDVRFLGDRFHVNVNVTTNKHFDDVIMWTFSEGAKGTYSPLCSGNFFVAPDIAGEITPRTSLTGSVSSHLTVIPRTLHVKNTPVIGMYKVINLHEAAKSAVPFRVETNCCEGAPADDSTPPVVEPTEP